LAERLREKESPYAPFYRAGLETPVMPVRDDDELDRFAGRWPILGSLAQC